MQTSAVGQKSDFPLLGNAISMVEKSEPPSSRERPSIVINTGYVLASTADGPSHAAGHDRKCPWMACVVALLVCQAASQANVVVISNRAGQTVSLRISSQHETLETNLAPGDCAPFLTYGRATAACRPAASKAASSADEYLLKPNTAYFLQVTEADGIELHEIDLGGTRLTRADRRPQEANLPVIIPVSLWVDDDQPFKESFWMPRLVQRLEEAAAIVEKYSGVEFRLQHTGEWDSDDDVTTFNGSLGEFINEVDPQGTLAIGFTSQYSVRQPRTKLGGTRFPLDHHILIRESRDNTEIEHVEVLAHELGHYLGAMHSIEPDSVMRPLLGDGLARGRSFRVKFDPVNSLVMSLVGEEMRGSSIGELKALSPQTRARLEEIYTTFALFSPDDPIPPKYIMLLKQ